MKTTDMRTKTLLLLICLIGSSCMGTPPPSRALHHVVQYRGDYQISYIVTSPIEKDGNGCITFTYQENEYSPKEKDRRVTVCGSYMID